MKRRGFLQGVTAAIAFLSATASGFGASVVKVCSKVAPGKRRIILPPIPRWNTFTDDIDRADYMERSEDFERAFLPKNLVFPREGQVWEVVRDCEVYGREPFKNPIAILKVRLHQGQRVRILPVNHPKPLQVQFQRLAPGQANDILWARTAPTVPGQGEEKVYFNETFRLVST